jgi:hypothetical protein
MSEELVPPDFLISPELFEVHFYRNEISPTIHQLALDGQLQSIHNRFICWRMFLGILPKNGPIDLWVTRITDLRTKYEEIIESQRVPYK